MVLERLRGDRSGEARKQEARKRGDSRFGKGDDSQAPRICEGKIRTLAQTSCTATARAEMRMSRADFTVPAFWMGLGLLTVLKEGPAFTWKDEEMFFFTSRPLL